MSSLVNGINTSLVEVQGISAHGLWLWVLEKDYFLSYEDYPWFANAKVQDVFHVQLLHGCHLYWPELDVDLDIDALEHPEAYPLKSPSENRHTLISAFPSGHSFPRNTA